MNSKLKVKVNKSQVIEVDPGQPQTLLEALEQAGVETRYHCRSGFCGACRTTLISGEVEYINDPLAYMRPQEILPCACKAKTDLEIEH
ncbi:MULTISPECIES: class I ribonucleotide reductase maintenance protein YfaE [Gammaproteobacteria]|uniref:class I ribonucleotide reductase maintenance protein YfaE n=1 Tax=Gammaproteobacteria TaxID=1236 RepID=UPI000DCFC9FD|nr:MULTISPECIES: class I ribonucleotide reductase maintenance protein YfaE [Gammaproteobacteria]RTE87304.1 2Fe-2S ferredoxin-like protein [Aliidiomarina sp. B3213]TCZ92911.1 2Fe-2S ferredoxin-like protein [Lysobacter sp. N42]